MELTSWQQLKDEETIKALFEPNGVIAVPGNVRVVKTLIVIDGVTQSPPSDLEGRIAYAEVAANVAVLLDEALLVYAEGEETISARVKHALADFNREAIAARNLLESLREGRAVPA